MSDHHPAMCNEAADLPKWYYRDGKDVFGPYTLKELADFVRRGRIGPHDAIWLSSSPHWVRADRVALLFRLADCTPETARKQPVRGRAIGFVQKGVSGIGLALGVAISLPIWAAEQVFAVLGSIVSHLRFVHVLAITCIFLIGLVAWSVPKLQERMKSPTMDAYSLCESLWDEALLLKENEADPSEWEELNQRAHEELQPLFTRLEKTAGASDRAAQLLVWAGRDCLLPALASRGEWEDHISAEFKQHMSDAKRVCGGAKLDYGATELRKARLRWIPVQEISSENTSWIHDFEIWIIAAEVLLVLSGIGWWICRRA